MTNPSDVYKFEKFNLGEMKNKVTDNQGWLRLLLGAGDPFSTKVWNKVLHKDWEPIVDQWGGAAPDVYGKAEAAGINSQSGQNMHNVAKGIAGVMAAGGAAGSATGAGGAGGFFGNLGSTISGWFGGAGGGEAMGTGAAPGESTGSFTGSALKKPMRPIPQNTAHFDRSGFNAVDSQLQQQLAEYLAKQKLKESEPGWWGTENTNG